MKFKTPEKLTPLTVEDVGEVLQEVLDERKNRGSRSERIAIRISKETLVDVHELADALGMRSATTDRVMLPDVIKAAVALANQTVN